MKYTIQILQKTIVKEYYRQNVGFLFAILLLAGSFMRSQEHITLGKLAINLPSILTIYGIIWTIYSIKTYFFSLRLLDNPTYAFLYNVALLPKFQRFWALCLMQINLLTLNLIYSIFVAFLAIHEQKWGAIYAIIILNLALIFGGVFLVDSKLKKQNFVQNSTRFLPNFHFNFKTPYPFFFVRYLLNKQPILFFLSKVGACLLLIGLCNLYPTDEYDERLFSLGGLFVAAIDMFITTQVFEFENQYFKQLRNLPLSAFERILQHSKTFFVLFIPEFLVLFHYFPSNVNYLISLQTCVFIFSLNTLIISILQINIPSEKIFIWVFYGGILIFLLIMFKVPILLISFINFVAGFIVFRKNYYLSETLNS